MNDRHLHIISFDVPYPPNYGGVIDVFYKIKILASLGVKVHLHCFQYGRGEHDVLSTYCEEVHYYKRDTSLIKALSCCPYIVASRVSESMSVNLLNDDYPILCEGLHTAALLEDARFNNRSIYVRVHNVEHDYYRLLASAEKNILKKMYLRVEASKLCRYEAVLSHAKALFAISAKDYEYFSAHYDNVHLLPAFNALDDVNARPGIGTYVLYHGNLSVAENYRAAEWLVENVFRNMDIPCVVAGMNPPQQLVKSIAAYDNIRLEVNPSHECMQRLIAEAHVNVLVTDQATGLKLKLLNALYQGRFCLVNEKMILGTNLESVCEIADTPQQFIEALQRLMTISFTQQDLEKRKHILDDMYQNRDNAAFMVNVIFG